MSPDTSSATVQSPDRLVKLCAAMLALAAALPSFLGSDFSFKPIFYGLVLLPALLMLVTRQLKPERILRQCPTIALLAIPLMYWSLTNAWSEQPDNVYAFLRRSLTLFVFLLVVANLVIGLGNGKRVVISTSSALEPDSFSKGINS